LFRIKWFTPVENRRYGSAFLGQTPSKLINPAKVTNPTKSGIVGTWS
jgi:hypothetical protein